METVESNKKAPRGKTDGKGINWDKVTEVALQLTMLTVTALISGAASAAGSHAYRSFAESTGEESVGENKSVVSLVKKSASA